jgi:hypothetical protein
MSAGYQDLFLSQGDTFTTQLTLDDSYGNPYNLTGFRIGAQARTSYYTANASLIFTTSISDANNGVIQLSANSATTANVPTKTLVYDVLIKDASNNVTKILEGRVFIDPTVTPLTSF